MSSPEWVTNELDGLDGHSVPQQGSGPPSRTNSPVPPEPGPSPLPSTSAIPTPVLDDFYNLQSVAFQAEDRVFQVLKQGFMAPGTYFQPMLADPSNVSGLSTNNPIFLEVKISDFRAFLRVLYPFWNFGSYEEGQLDIDDWTGVLRLSKQWNFTKIREKAVAELTRLLTGNYRDMIRLGQELNVADWLRQGLIDLATEICKSALKPSDIVGDRPIFIENEWRHIANVYYLCQKLFKTQPQEASYCCNNYCGPSYNSAYVCGICGKFWQHQTLANLVDSIFSVELARARSQPPPVHPKPIHNPCPVASDPVALPTGTGKKGKKGGKKKISLVNST